MTQVKIDVTDVLGRAANTGDRVFIRASALRGSAKDAGKIIVPRAIEIRLDSGVSTVELEPGPALVQFRCGTSVDSTARPIAVPDQTEPVTLRALLESDFHYEPPVVSAVARDAARAVQAATKAESTAKLLGSAEAIHQSVLDAGAARDRAEQAESNASGSARASADSAGLSASSASKSAESERQAGLTRSEVDAAAAAAKASEEKASGSSRLAEDAKSAAAGHASGAAKSEASAKAEADRSKGEADRAASMAGNAASSATTAEVESERARQAAANAAGDVQNELGELRDGAVVAKGQAAESARASAESAEKADQSARSAAEVVSTGVADATPTVKGKLMLTGDLAGTADAPTVPKLADKADKTTTDTALAGKADKQAMETALAGKLAASEAETAITGGKLSRRTTGKQLQTDVDPVSANDLARKQYVDAMVNARTPQAVVVAAVPATTVAGTIYYETG